MKIIITLIVLGIILAIVADRIISHVEQPDYTVVKSNGNIEIRDYAPMILAEVEVSGERKQAISNGFKILADYIFGNNTSKVKMEMTAPVTNQQLNEKMAMTAPVMQESHADKWRVRFVMPKKYSMQTLPKPNSSEVTITSLPARRFAVYQFSGLADDEKIKRHTKELESYISDEKLKPIGGTVLAFYNPPWTIPFLRRNEVMIEIETNR